MWDEFADFLFYDEGYIAPRWFGHPQSLYKTTPLVEYLNVNDILNIILDIMLNVKSFIVLNSRSLTGLISPPGGKPVIPSSPNPTQRSIIITWSLACF